MNPDQQQLPVLDPMIRISLPYIIRVVSALEKLDQIPADATYLHAWSWTVGLQQQLNALYMNSVYSEALRSSRTLWGQLDNTLAAINSPSDMGLQIGPQSLWLLRSQRDQLLIALQAELDVVPAFFVSQKEGYDTLSLLENGLRLFPATLTKKVPEAVFDAEEVGRTVAFELATAAGFHIFRVIEAVLRRYHRHVTGGATPPSGRSIGAFLHDMRKKKVGDQNVLSVLDQIRKLHRNPLIHPDVTLDMEEAITVLGLARSALGPMLSVLPDV